MVAAAPAIDVRAVGAESFDDIYPLLLLFENRKMSRDDWYRMLFAYPWWNDGPRGFALYANGTAVGFIGTIFSSRRIAGRDRTFCNASCWIVREEYRHASMMLLRPVLAMRDCTLVNLTPTMRSFEIFKKLGFRELESTSLLLAPLANPAALLGGSFSQSEEAFACLDPEERRIHQDLALVPRVTELVLRRHGRQCYLVATRRHVKRIPIADVQYLGNPDFFWENRLLAQYAVFVAMGAAGIALDARFANGHNVRFALRRRALRSYRPAEPDLTPQMVDNLFSEVTVLKI